MGFRNSAMHEFLFVHEVLSELPDGSFVLDAGCGKGSFDYRLFPHLKIVGVDIRRERLSPGTLENASFIVSDLTHFPVRGSVFDFVICQYVLEHVKNLSDTMDSITSSVKPGGKMYLSFPNSSSFDDRFYRFAGIFAKYGMFKFEKRLEHVQRLNFLKVTREFYRRGMRLLSLAEAPSGFSWMNEPRVVRFQKGFITGVSILKGLGIDLASRSNYLTLFEKVGRGGVRQIFHVCRSCGRHLTEEVKDKLWICPFCGTENIKV